VWCANCFYSLHGLTEHRCPECGRPFNPDDPRTFAHAPRRRAFLPILLSYLAVFAVTIAFWVSQNPARWPGAPALTRADLLLVGCAAATGPIGWVLRVAPTAKELIPSACALNWTLWLLVVYCSRLRDCPPLVHVVLALLWCSAGCAPFTLMIT
jgi:hypothetical protein